MSRPISRRELTKRLVLGENTLNDIAARGYGPDWFAVDRRIYYTESDVCEWIAKANGLRHLDKIPDYITSEELCAMYGVGKNQLSGWRDRGTAPPCHKILRTNRYLADEAEEFFRKREVKCQHSTN